MPYTIVFWHRQRDILIFLTDLQVQTKIFLTSYTLPSVALLLCILPDAAELASREDKAV